MSNEVIAATVSALISGGVGYAVREYLNQVTPFFQITEIDGSLTRRSDEVEISSEIIQKTENTFYIKPIKPNSNLGEIWDHWDRAEDIKKSCPELAQILDEILFSTTDDSLISALGRGFKKTYFDKLLMILLVNNRIKFPKLPRGSKEKIHSYFEDENNGMVWFDFPNDASNFGRGLKNKAIKARTEPFIKLICHLHHESIFKVMRQYKDILETEYKVAMEVSQPLERVVNDRSRWVHICYLANLSNNPIIIENKATLFVVDRIKFKEPAYLALIKTDSNEESHLVDTVNPLVVKPGNDIVFAVITEKTQSEINLGTALRESFNRKQGKCYVTVKLRRVGFLRTQKYKSQFSPFFSSKDKHTE
jgi:hypothetical protein